MGKISTALRKRLSKPLKRRKIIPFSELKALKEEADNLLDSIVTQEELAQLNPMHAVYVWFQNLISVFAENCVEFKFLSKFYDLLEAAEDKYLPQGPPMSPLTRSYFNYWSFFDLTFDLDQETIGSCFLEVGDIFGIPEEFNPALANMVHSRMGLYEQIGSNQNLVFLKEILSKKSYPCICPAGYMGKEGEIWFARVMAPPTEAVDYSIVMTTPYVVLGSTKRDWIDFFSRQSISIDDADRDEKMKKLMKYGQTRHFWNEYIMDAYVNFQNDVIFLTGIPDLPKTLPHSLENSD